MTSFTDDDLSRYKKKATRSNTYTNQDCDMAMGMIHRLEAAEAVCSEIRISHPNDGNCGCSICDLLKVWEKSKGEV